MQRLQDPPLLLQDLRACDGHPSCASGAPAWKVSPLLACPGSQLVLEGAQPTAGCAHASAPWAHVVPCPPGSLQRVHPGPSCSLLCPGHTLSRVLPAPYSGSTRALPAASALCGLPVTEPGLGWTLPSSADVSASPPHALRTVLSLGKVGPLGAVAVAVRGSHPQIPVLKTHCLLWARGANSRVRPTPGEVCIPLCRPDRMVPARGTSGRPQGPLDAVLGGQSSGSGLGPELEEEAARGFPVVPELPASRKPQASLRCVQGAGVFHPHPRPSAGCLLLGTNTDQPVRKGSFLAGPPGGGQLGARGKGLGVGGETQAAAAVD